MSLGNLLALPGREVEDRDLVASGPGRERDLVRVRATPVRLGAVGADAVGDPLAPAAHRGHDVELRPRRGGVDDPAAVRRPARGRLGLVGHRPPGHPAALGVAHVDLRGTLAAQDHGDLPAVGAEAGA